MLLYFLRCFLHFNPQLHEGSDISVPLLEFWRRLSHSGVFFVFHMFQSTLHAGTLWQVWCPWLTFWCEKWKSVLYSFSNIISTWRCRSRDMWFTIYKFNLNTIKENTCWNMITVIKLIPISIHTSAKGDDVIQVHGLRHLTILILTPWEKRLKILRIANSSEIVQTTQAVMQTAWWGMCRSLQN